MFQRLKGAIDSIDSRISEEQARQKAAPARSNSARRPRNSSSLARRDKDDSVIQATSQSDPADFESVLSDASDLPSRSATPGTPNVQDGEASKSKKVDQGDGPRGASPAEALSSALSDLPTEVRVKMRRLEKLEIKFQELLRSYRIAHPKAKLVDSFETTLREHTPLTSISDPSAFVEYLNQVSTKGNLAMEELKRILAERNAFKSKLDMMEKEQLSKADAGAHSKDEPASAVKDNEDFFSYDQELPRLEAELKSRKEEVETLKSVVKVLKNDLSVTRESTASMATSLEEATKELSTFRDSKEQAQSDSENKSLALEDVRQQLQSKVDAMEKELAKAKAKPSKTSTAEGNEASISTTQQKLVAAQENAVQSQQRLQGLRKLVQGLQLSLEKSADDDIALKSKLSEADQATLGICQAAIAADIEAFKTAVTEGGKDASATVVQQNETASKTDTKVEGPVSNVAESVTTSAAKKKNKKKKKKTDKPSEDGANSKLPFNEAMNAETSGEPTRDAGSVRIDKDPQNTLLVAVMNRIEAKALELAHLNAKILRQRQDLADGEVEIDAIDNSLAVIGPNMTYVQKRIKDQEDLKEEIESLRDDLITVGSEHVDTKHELKDVKTQRSDMEKHLKELETQMEELRATAAASPSNGEDHAMASEAQKTKISALERELSASQDLASTRYKDVTELKAVLQKAQPELVSLRSDSAAMKSLRAEMEVKGKVVKELESKAAVMKAEVAALKTKLSERDTEVKTLNEKIQQESNQRIKMEETLRGARTDLVKSDSDKKVAQESLERTTGDVRKLQEATAVYRSKIRDLEQQIVKLNGDVDRQKEELGFKVAQGDSAQTLISSMRDQSAELGMQMKELRDRSESLEEELADAHRLLSERSREGETMRRLLADVEGTADAKVRDMKVRLDAAIDERDRAEDEASTMGKKRARELENLRTKSRDAERTLRRALDDKEELERAEKDWARQKEELQTRTEHSTQEMNDVKQAMNQLREALDESEKQVQFLEQQRFELRTASTDMQARLEKLQKTNKTLSDDIKSLHSLNKSKALEMEAQSSRTSTDSAISRPKLASLNGPRERASPKIETESTNTGQVDYVYLKNVLLQFLEQRDKNHQKQLIPVLGMLLHFDRKDEQKWMSAITTK
ncbi:MAG: hypothetical protein M1814_003389 [Vezdaea aestivalis]|nr:MAG: hypothetical protein M1814_003389 [Vezdaea aestivalis]